MDDSAGCSGKEKALQENYRSQIRQIKKLTAHYITFDNSQKEGICDECKDSIKKKSMGNKRLSGSAAELKSDVIPMNRCKCGLCCPNCQHFYYPSIAIDRSGREDGKSGQEFTPSKADKRCASVSIGDNQGTNCYKVNSAPSSLAQPLSKSQDPSRCLQPSAKHQDPSVSVITMPSQGQVFSPTPYRRHNKDTIRLAIRYRPATAHCHHQQPRESGWKRDVKSATIYTRYRNPDLFSLMYSDLKSGSVSSLDILTVHDYPRKKFTRLRLLHNDLSTEYYDADAESKMLEKRAKAKKQLLTKKRTKELGRFSNRPSIHWYELTSPQFHLEMRRNNYLLKTLCS